MSPTRQLIHCTNAGLHSDLNESNMLIGLDNRYIHQIQRTTVTLTNYLLV